MNDSDRPLLNVCAWIGDKEGCRHPTVYGKSYCETHYDRMYITLFSEMADYIIEKELTLNRI